MILKSKVINPNAPIFQALPKIHKEENPIRLMVKSYIHPIFFNNEYCMQNKEIAMRLPQSRILAELFLNDFKKKYLWNKDRNRIKDSR